MGKIPKNDEIDKAINDQRMLINMNDLMQKSIPNGRGFYSFDVMASAAEKIILTNVHPIIANFVALEVGKIYKKIQHINLPIKLKTAFSKLGIK